MCSGRCAAITALALTVILSVGNAYSNGINPPRPSSATKVKAICKKHSSGREYVILRTRIIVGSESAKSLNFVIGGATEQIDITDIRTITLNAGKVDPDGFIEGSLIRRNGTEEKTVKIQVKIKDAFVSISGFRENGTRVTIGLSKCKSIDFSSN